jgi:hypothetical protein
MIYGSRSEAESAMGYFLSFGLEVSEESQDRVD